MKFVFYDPTPLPPISKEDLKNVKFSSELDPDEFDDNKKGRDFLSHARVGDSNVLAEADHDDSARRAMRKDAK